MTDMGDLVRTWVPARRPVSLPHHTGQRHRLAGGLLLAGALVLSSCTGEDADDQGEPPPAASAQELLIQDGPAPRLTALEQIDADNLGLALADYAMEDPGGSGTTVTPEECRAKGDLLGGDGAPDAAGVSTSDQDEQWVAALVVVKEGRPLADVRSGRESCDEVTVTADDYEGTHSEEVGDGPDIDEADATFVGESTYTSKGRVESTMHRYVLVAEQVRVIAAEE